MRRATVLVLAAVLAGCGEEEAGSTVAPATTTQAAPATTATAPAAAATARKGTRIALRGSEFGPMLWGPGPQAIYAFENDQKNRSNCYGECARLWPPVYTKGRPRAGKGIRPGLLGTTKRRDGRRQVTYAGRPLYYYAHEGPGVVECHEIFLNGGLWWAIGTDGRNRP